MFIKAKPKNNMNKEKIDYTVLLEKDNNISKSKQNFVHIQIRRKWHKYRKYAIDKIMFLDLMIRLIHETYEI